MVLNQATGFREVCTVMVDSFRSLRLQTNRLRCHLAGIHAVTVLAGLTGAEDSHWGVRLLVLEYGMPEVTTCLWAAEFYLEGLHLPVPFDFMFNCKALKKKSPLYSVGTQLNKQFWGSRSEWNMDLLTDMVTKHLVFVFPSRGRKNVSTSAAYLSSFQYEVGPGKLLHVSSDLISGLWGCRWCQAIMYHYVHMM